MLSKIDTLQSKDIDTEIVKVPEWDGEVAVTGLTLAEKDQWTKSIMSGPGKELGEGKVDMEGATAKLCIMCMRDEDGKQLFSFKDVTALQKRSASALDRIFQVAQRLSGIGQEDIEETVKNSGKTQIPDSD
jgi:hypothetical protein